MSTDASEHVFASQSPEAGEAQDGERRPTRTRAFGPPTSIFSHPDCGRARVDGLSDMAGSAQLSQLALLLTVAEAADAARCSTRTIRPGLRRGGARGSQP